MQSDKSDSGTLWEQLGELEEVREAFNLFDTDGNGTTLSLSPASAAVRYCVAGGPPVHCVAVVVWLD